LLISAFVLSHSTLFTIGNPGKTDKKEQTNDDEGQQQIKLSDAVPSPPTQNTLNHLFFLLEELVIESNNKSKDSLLNVSIPFGKALRVLLGKIISPNAP